MENKSACFTGHRRIASDKIPAIKEKLRKELISCIETGYSDFYNGGAYGFDLLSAGVLLELKEQYPHIRLHLIVPCANQTVEWHKDSIVRYQEIKARADEVKCLSPFYYDGCMQARNRYMVDNSSLCIAYLERADGGSAYTAKYAEKQGKAIINIFDEI